MQERFRFKDREEIEILIEGAKSGSQKALGEILEYFREVLVRYCRRKKHHEDDSRIHDSDAIQEACLKACENISFFQGKSGNEVETWLISILRNVIKNIRRQNHSDKRDVSREIPLDVIKNVDQWASTRSTPLEELILKEQVGEYLEAFGRLANHYQQVLRMRNEQHLSFQEIGAQLGYSENGAQKLFHRAMDKLREKIDSRNGKARKEPTSQIN